MVIFKQTTNKLEADHYHKRATREISEDDDGSGGGPLTDYECDLFDAIQYSCSFYSMTIRLRDDTSCHKAEISQLR